MSKHKLWKQCQITIYVMVSMIMTAVLWMVGYGSYEMWTLKNHKDNDTISHGVALLTSVFPALPYVFWSSLFVVTLFWIIVGCHWFVKGFWWKKAVIVDDSEDEK